MLFVLALFCRAFFIINNTYIWLMENQRHPFIGKAIFSYNVKYIDGEVSDYSKCVKMAEKLYLKSKPFELYSRFLTVITNNILWLSGLLKKKRR